ncbi:YbjN domain-containing protein [Sphingomonas sp. C3-2]|uniref:YbjN domain-containing protein n=1 Tax=Sphingomonas sp. C3-2 TaxID=3062169 RepID=UPI00294B80B2|nr:YbjN domain-containing protein [Sphingomonas sp. C3-2]WOK37171.1 YbjN domain-containing protein [Sphingomonas sp. C3-2]
MSLKYFAAAALAACALVPGTGFAQMISAKEPAKMVSLLQKKGYRAEIETDESGTRIRSADSGRNFTIFFMSCDDQEKNCTTIQFYAGFSDLKSTQLSQINEWNKTRRFARAYIDGEGDPVIEMDVDLDFNGIPEENFMANLEIFTDSLSAYVPFLKE